MNCKSLLAAAALVAASAVAAQACDRGADVCTFTLFNNTSHKVQSFYASPSRVNRWEEDILGDKVLLAGGRVPINLSDGRPDCIYDFKILFDDGDEIVRKGINVCRLGRYTLDE